MKYNFLLFNTFSNIVILNVNVFAPQSAILVVLEFWAEPSTSLAFPIWYCCMAASLQDSTYIYSCIYAVSTSSICPNTTGAQTDPLPLLPCHQDFQHKQIMPMPSSDCSTLGASYNTWTHCCMCHSPSSSMVSTCYPPQGAEALELLPLLPLSLIADCCCCHWCDCICADKRNSDLEVF